LTTEFSEKTQLVARVRNLAATLFTTDAAIHQWMSRPESALGGVAPVDLLETSAGARQVENLLRALAHGQFV
jgi:putative toxin-antitoxin system antitoxin component (TIGR02293 family)